MRSSFEGHFSVPSIDYKGEDAANNERPNEKISFRPVLRWKGEGVGSVRELTERKVSPGAFARLNDAASEPRTSER